MSLISPRVYQMWHSAMRRRLVFRACPLASRRCLSSFFNHLASHWLDHQRSYLKCTLWGERPCSSRIHETKTFPCLLAFETHSTVEMGITLSCQIIQTGAFGCFSEMEHLICRTPSYVSLWGQLHRWGHRRWMLLKSIRYKIMLYYVILLHTYIHIYTVYLYLCAVKY